MNRTGEQFELAAAFLDEARGALVYALRSRPEGHDPEWRSRHLEAMTYWARAHRHHRVCHAAQNAVATANAI
jgi:hypothetical protein